MKTGVTYCIFFAFAFVASTSGAGKPETPHLAFVTEYIHELAAIEDIRANGERELKNGTKNQMFSTAIHISVLTQLELRTEIDMLKGMHLNPPFEWLIPNITGLYGQKIALHQKLIDISSTFIAGSKPDVDYGELAADMPKIRARLEFIDKSLFDAAPMVFATLIDQRPDSKNHLSHLVITKADRSKLISDLTDDFGSKLDRKQQNFTVSAATVLKTYLLKKGYKCSDEP